MINLIQFSSTSHVYRELLTHRGEGKHMVDGEGLGDNGGEDSVGIPFPRVERKITLITQMKIIVAAALWFVYDFVLPRRRVF
jgi:hypothetical protein